MNITTELVTKGVIKSFKTWIKRLNTISIKVPIKQIPKIVDNIHSGPPPSALTIKPAERITPKKAKLVP